MAELLNKYMNVFRAFLNDREIVRLTQTEIGERLGIPKATVHRLVVDLVAEEMLCQDPDGRYRMGPFFAIVMETVRLAEARTAARYREEFSARTHTDTHGEERGDGEEVCDRTE